MRDESSFSRRVDTLLNDVGADRRIPKEHLSIERALAKDFTRAGYDISVKTTGNDETSYGIAHIFGENVPQEVKNIYRRHVGAAIAYVEDSGKTVEEYIAEKMSDVFQSFKRKYDKVKE